MIKNYVKEVNRRPCIMYRKKTKLKKRGKIQNRISGHSQKMDLHFFRNYPSLTVSSLNNIEIFLGKLIAIGIEEVMSIGINSRAFYYDLNYKDFSLGTYSALLECFFTRKLKLRYFTLGSYDHT